MGREIQKKKIRTARPKVRRDHKSNRRIFNNPIIAANYDPKQTLAQNYRRLGLATKLTAPTGGTEKSIRILEDEKSENAAAAHHARDIPGSRTQAERTNHDRLAIVNKKAEEVVPEEVKIERDPKTGRILRIVSDESADAAQRQVYTPLDDPLNQLDDAEDDGEEFHGFDNHHAAGGHIGGRVLDSGNAVIRQLEARVAQLASLPRQKRRQSERELEWVHALVEKHGEDYDAMFRDRKLNVMQQSKGDLKRRVRKYLDG